MHLRKLPDGSIRLTRLNPWDVQTFRSLPELADFTQDPKAEKRLLPTPAVESDLSPELAMDWVEYVVPELRESFAENLAVVMADLASLTEEPPGSEEDEDFEDGEEDDDDEGEDEDEETTEAAAAGRPAEAPEAEDAAVDENPQNPWPTLPGTDVADPMPLEESVLREEPAAAVPHYGLTIPSGHAEAWFLAMNQARLVLSARYGIDSEHQPELSKLLAAGHIEYWFQYELFVSLQGWLVDAVLDPE